MNQYVMCTNKQAAGQTKATSLESRIANVGARDAYGPGK